MSTPHEIFYGFLLSLMFSTSRLYTQKLNPHQAGRYCGVALARLSALVS
ncbi:Uncharacterised protein [Vibrio cholerae]|nr:Uncharacterised protein [Vibrio cholerae]